ncbi:Zinc finger MYM-type protein 1 [Merluccius polli]|uniref:Zinc finger MYM-type protein 1 n=1 Tax=Merluccius polli TaxID=89951 RepID=A0AA47MLB4_MERPO|nr:Zinc finger MYM-type protein 1 [Merluccius polli]
MSGKHSGVQARIKEVAKLAFYVHCNTHCLNLVLVDTVRGIPEAECFFSLLKQLYIYMSGSAVHPKWLQVQQEMYTGAPRELQVLSDTRWASRYYACRNLWDRLPAVVKVLEELCDDHSGERSVGARGLLPQIDFQFIVFLAIFKKLLGDAKLLSDMLQSSSLDLAKAVDLVEALISTFESYRSEQVFDDLWDTVLELAKQCDVSIDTAPKRKRTLSSKLKGYHVLSTAGSQETGNGKDYYRTGMFNLVLDRMLSELRNRFSNQNCDIMRGIQALNPSSKSFCDKDSLFAFAKLYGCDLVDLEHELYQIKRVLDRKCANFYVYVRKLLCVILHPLLGSEVVPST